MAATASLALQVLTNTSDVFDDANRLRLHRRQQEDEPDATARDEQLALETGAHFVNGGSDWGLGRLYLTTE